jgi:hypothetical protein
MNIQESNQQVAQSFSPREASRFSELLNDLEDELDNIQLSEETPNHQAQEQHYDSNNYNQQQYQPQ